MTHVHPLLRCVHELVTDVLGKDEPIESALQSGPYPDTLTRTTAIVKVLPHLRKREEEGRGEERRGERTQWVHPYQEHQ